MCVHVEHTYVHTSTRICAHVNTHIYVHPEHTPVCSSDNHHVFSWNTNTCPIGTRMCVHVNTHMCTRGRRECAHVNTHTHVHTWNTHTHVYCTCEHTHIYARAENTDTHECSSDNKHVVSWNTTVCLIGTQPCVHVNTHMCTREHTHIYIYIYAHPEHTHTHTHVRSSENKHVFT